MSWLAENWQWYAFVFSSGAVFGLGILVVELIWRRWVVQS